MRIPLHLNDNNAEATLKRIELHTAMSMITRGKGFRYPSKKNNKPSRIEKIAEQYYGNSK